MAVSNYQAIIAEAKSKVGMHEVPKGSNDGPELREYLSGTDFEPGQSWCLYFAYSVVRKAWPKGQPFPVQLKNTGSCEELRQWAKKHGKLLSSKNGVDSGAIFLLIDPVADHAHHAGIITKSGNGEFSTIEGNSNSDGSREGWEVVEHSRPFSDNIVFVTF